MKSLLIIVVCLYIGAETLAAKKFELPFATTKQREAVKLVKALRSIELEIANPNGQVRIARSLRQRRQSSSAQQEYLDAHNTARSIVSPTATNMRKMKWSDELAQVAQNYANKCIWGHNSARTSDTKALTSQFSYVGENLYVTSRSSVLPSSAVESWDDEKSDYSYGTQACTGVCGHYTQVVWANSEYVGCASSTCSSFTGLSSSFNGGTIVVCNYGPGGNYGGQKPFESGTSCNSCPSGYSCSNNLCVDGSESNNSGSETSSSESSGSTSTNTDNSSTGTGQSSNEDCFTGDGSDYQGTASTTVSGKTCLNWSDVYSFLPGNNYCRNYFAAYGFTEPVCYMQPGTNYVESCGVPKCDKK
ncbi:peptidase inhibitor R3HDML-like [Ostrea edulis]|uniref:peptidase inhibitor R3HDML-like n=1 Tax=Ostrea edulis TaxID=37623 RepID=UPI0024AF1E07|nr:peptidase inhibitor R3HDML-like [Ostrea edulis]